MRIFSVALLLVVLVADSAFAGILINTPRVSAGQGRRFTRLSTAPLKKTNPKLGVYTKENDVSYYFQYRNAEARYEQKLYRWEKDRYAMLERKQKAMNRLLAGRSRRPADVSDNVKMMNASSTNRNSNPQENARDPRAWFNNKIAGSFGQRPSQQAANMQTAKKAESPSQLRSSLSLLDGAESPVAVKAPVKKEGLWSKFLRVLGLKK